MQTIQKMFEHIHWANTRMIEALKNRQSEAPKATELFAHILHAEWVWLTRLQGKDSAALPIWSNVDLDTCIRMVERNREGYAAYFANSAASETDRPVRYRNQSGKEFTNSVQDILTHVALHGQYHRGQINALLRAEGDEPVNVDFITFVR